MAQTRLHPLLLKLIALVVSCALTFGLFEWYFRSQVPESGVTIARNPSIPGLTHELRPNFSTLYFGNEVVINSSGFRGPEFLPKRDETIRMALIGDSITFGHVPWEQTLGEQLERQFRRLGYQVEALNFGVPAYNAEHVALVLEHHAIEREPDVVVYLFFNNDVLPSKSATEVDPSHVVDLFSTFPLRSAFLEWAGRSARTLARTLELKASSGYVASVLSSWRNSGEERLQSVLQGMQSTSAAGRACLVAVNVPAPVPQTHNPFAEIETGFLEVSSRLGIGTVDLRNAFPDDAVLLDLRVGMFDHHPNAESNEVMATFLAARLLEGDCGDRFRGSSSSVNAAQVVDD